MAHQGQSIVTNYTRATEAADAENWLAAIAFAVLAVVDEFRLPDTTFGNGPTSYAALRAVDEIRSHAQEMTQAESVYARVNGKAILDILTRHGLNEGKP